MSGAREYDIRPGTGFFDWEEVARQTPGFRLEDVPDELRYRFYDGTESSRFSRVVADEAEEWLRAGHPGMEDGDAA